MTKGKNSKAWDEEDYKSFKALLKRVSNLEENLAKLIGDIYK